MALDMNFPHQIEARQIMFSYHGSPIIPMVKLSKLHYTQCEVRQKIMLLNDNMYQDLEGRSGAVSKCSHLNKYNYMVR